jgi:small conductance mechanosensitive channel
VLNMERVTDFLSTTGLEIGTKILAAIAFWIIGRWLIAKVVHIVQSIMGRNKLDPTLSKYLGSIIAVLLNIVLVIGILGYFGIQTTSFAALLAGAGLAIGAAWGGLLAHFAAGAFMLVLRPFKVGDFVSAGGVTGTIMELGLFGTTILTPDNVKTIIGNNKVFSETIQNFSALPIRRVERTAQLANGVEPLAAIEKFRAAVLAIPNISTTQAPEIDILDFKLEGPVVAIRPYTHTDHYWQVYFATNAAIAKVCKENGWPIPATTFIRKEAA